MPFFRSVPIREISIKEKYSYTYSVDGEYRLSEFVFSRTDGRYNFSDYFNIRIPRNQFNLPVKLGNFVNSCVSILENCSNFNSTLQLGENLTNCANMLNACYSFNMPVVIPKNLINGYNMFSGCVKWSQLDVFDVNTVEDGSGMFRGTSNLKLNIDCNFKRLVNGYAMFDSCGVSHVNVTIPNTVQNVKDMFHTRTITPMSESLYGDIYVEVNSLCNYTSMIRLMYSTTSKPTILNIHSNQANTSWVWSMSNAQLSYTTIPGGNGLYNAAYNIYLYNNYGG